MKKKKDSNRTSALIGYLFEPVDNASVTFFRVIWGVVAATWAWDYLSSGKVTQLYVAPQFHFSYPGFEWVQPWSGSGMYWHFWVMIFAALAIAVGFCYRVAALTFAISFTYFFLLEQTNYQNHYYLMVLVSWAICVLPLHRELSWDSRRGWVEPSDTCPRWVLICLQLHVAIPYFYGGLAKLVPDWMLGQPMGLMLANNADMPVVGGFFGSAMGGITMSWMGMLFDLAIVPALMWPRTRVFAFLACLVFHVSNAALFSIHIFPWLMIGASTLFFRPSWPREMLGAKVKAKSSSHQPIAWSQLSGRRKTALVLAAVYLTFHMLWPLRQRLYEGDPGWTERGHFFAWRMMLRGKTGGARFYLTNSATGEAFSPEHQTLLSFEQAGKFPRNPLWVYRFGRYLGEYYAEKLSAPVEVRALVMLSLNGRKPQLLLDPQVDLMQIEPDEFWSSGCVMPLTEPLQREPWNVPIERWQEFIEIPQMDGMIQPSSEKEE